MSERRPRYRLPNTTVLFESETYEVILRDLQLTEMHHDESGGSSRSVMLPLVQRVEASTDAGASHLTIWGLFKSGNPVRLGPFPPEGAARVEAVIRAGMIDEVTPLYVTGEELRANGGAYHCALIEVVDWWAARFEGSSFVDAWLTPPPGSAWECVHDGRKRYVRVVGVWLCDPTIEQSEHRGGYGHMGMSRANLCAVRMTEEPTNEPPPWYL